jgi:hypothetical protein
MSRESEYLKRRGWKCEGHGKRGMIKIVIWYKDGVNDGCQQWEAVQIERLKNPKVRERFEKSRR